MTKAEDEAEAICGGSKWVGVILAGLEDNLVLKRIWSKQYVSMRTENGTKRIFARRMAFQFRYYMWKMRMKVTSDVSSILASCKAISNRVKEAKKIASAQQTRKRETT